MAASKSCDFAFISASRYVSACSLMYSVRFPLTILADLCAGAGIALVYESEDYSIEEVEQSKQTDMEFAFSLCKNHNLAMKLYNSKMVVYDQTAYEKKAPAYTVHKRDMQTPLPLCCNPRIRTLGRFRPRHINPLKWFSLLCC